MILIYKKRMSPIELLSNSHRLPISRSSIYEPDLIETIIIPSNNTLEYLENQNKILNDRILFFHLGSKVQILGHYQISELTSEPLPV